VYSKDVVQYTSLSLVDITFIQGICFYGSTPIDKIRLGLPHELRNHRWKIRLSRS